MCGIAGLVDPRLTEAELRRRVELMVETLYHRGPDDAGIFVGVHAAIGMRRLSIIDVAGGSQPLANEDGSVHVVCNGEIYNFPELARELRRRGHRFRSRSDVETIPHAYEDDPRRFVERVGGMFAFALWDEKARRLTLARDRLGKKPLYYAETDGALAFASEIKALLACDPRLREPDPAAARWYVRYGFVPEPLTMFARIRVLPPAHELVFEGGRCRLRRYWQLPDEQAEHVTHTEARERLDALLRESVTSRLVSDVPLGIFLSGGIDSSAVAAYAQAGSTSALKTFTIGFDRPAWDESPDARVVAEHLGTDHHVLRLTEAELTSDLPDTLLRIVRHVDQPFADPSALPMYHVSRLAREHVTVILGGDGGDELFAGYSTYLGLRFAQRYGRLPGALRRALPPSARTAARVLPDRARYGLLRAAKVLEDSDLPFRELYFRKKTIIRDDLATRLCSDWPSTTSTGDVLPPELGELDRLSSLMVDPIATAGRLDLAFGLVNDMLVKVDRMSMANSLEVRSPLLDHHLVEYVVTLPSQLKLRGWETKAILRDTVRPYLPESVFSKPKRGFNVPLRAWLRGPLYDIANDYLAQPGGGSSDLFDPAAARLLLREHQAGKADHSDAIWLLLTYAAWHREYVAKPSAAPFAPRTAGAAS